MTFETRPLQLKNDGASAEQFRRMQFHMWGQAAGPWLSTDLEVTAGAGMTVDIGAGAGVVQGTTETYQGAYWVENRGVHTGVSLAASDPTNPRWDLIVVTINDSDVIGVLDSAVPQSITGTPAGSPSDPPTPANSIVLARAIVPAAASTPSQIDDLRTTATGQSVVAKAAYGGVVAEVTYNTDPDIRTATFTTIATMVVDVRDGYGYEIHLQTGDWYGLGDDENVAFQCDVGSTQLVKKDALGGLTKAESFYGAGYVSGLAAGSTNFNIQASRLTNVALQKDTGGAPLKAWIVERPA